MKRHLAAALLVLVSCQASSKVRCPEFDEAEEVFDQLAATVLDPSFADPRFARAAELFEAIPSQCERHGRAVAIARSIRDAQRTPGAMPPPAPRTAVSPPPARRKARSRDPAEMCRAFMLGARKRCPTKCSVSAFFDARDVCMQSCEHQLRERMETMNCPPGIYRAPRSAQTPSPPPSPSPSPPSPPPSSAARSTRRPPPRAAPNPTAPKKWTYCAYFLPSGNHKRSYCSPAKLEQAQRLCDEDIRRRGIEGTCACTEDQAFIADRCK